MQSKQWLINNTLTINKYAFKTQNRNTIDDCDENEFKLTLTLLLMIDIETYQLNLDFN